MFLVWPFFLGARPAADGPRKALADYAVKLLIYFGVTSLVWLMVAIFALLLLRQTRRQFANTRKEMVEDLVEGTLKDHERKQP